MDNPFYAVLYSDGGCKLSKGVGGWGVHGYLFDGNAPKTGTGLKDWLVTPKGYHPSAFKLTGAVRHDLWDDFPTLAEDPKVTNVNVIQYIDAVGSLSYKGMTNNLAELTAMGNALDILLNVFSEKHDGLKKAYIFTDSEYTKKGLNEWAVNWAANDWIKSTGEPVSNKEVWQKLLKLKEQVEEKGIELHVKWIRGHAGNHADFEQDDLGNSIADTYATKASIIAEEGRELEKSFKTTDPKGYWKPKVDANRMLANSNWYFNTFSDATCVKPDGRTIYYLGEHGDDDDFLCKPGAADTFSVVYLKEPEPVLEAIRRQQKNEDVKHHNSIIIGRLNYIFRPAIYTGFMIEDVSTLRRRNAKLDLYTHDKIPLTKELRPPRLAFNLIEVMEVLEHLLDSVIGGELPDQMRVTDISSFIYEKEFGKNKKEKNKIRPELNTGAKTLEVEVEHALKNQKSRQPITLSIGIDTPHRNALSALADRNPKVKIVTWPESNIAFRYATVVEAGDDAGIYAGFYSNLYILNQSQPS